jgi:nitroreductase/NAD-dependent dihydropyrimidine dehydrogenase PreA subunit
MLDFAVRPDRCDRCGRCVDDCPADIIHMGRKSPPSIHAKDEAKCLQCQHCLAVCPEGAISIFGRDPDRSLRLRRKDLPTLEQMDLLVRGRRSVRRYRDEDVDQELLGRLLSALANAPTGVNRRALTFRVVGDRRVMQGLRERLYRAAAAAVESGALPGDSGVARFAAEYLDAGRDVVLRGAPHVLVVSAPPDAPCGPEDVALALAYFELLAHSARLGTVWCGLLRMSLEALPQLKPLFGLPPDHHYYAMLFGVPAVRYARTVQRDDAAAVHHIQLD